MPETEQTNAPALDAVPDSLEEAEAEHAQVLQEIQQAQQTIQQAQQVIEIRTRRGIFLEGFIKAMSRKPAPTKRTNAQRRR